MSLSRTRTRWQSHFFAFQHGGEVLLQLAPPLRNRDTPFHQNGSQLVQQGRPFADQPVAHAVQRLHVELLATLQLDKPHLWPRRSLRDRFGIPIIVVLRLYIRPNIFRRHQPDLVSLITQETAKVVRTTASLHRHHARCQTRRQLDHALTMQTSAHNNRTSPVQPHHTATVLSQVDS
jgi:hypothetical protein